MVHVIILPMVIRHNWDVRYRDQALAQGLEAVPVQGQDQGLDQIPKLPGHTADIRARVVSLTYGETRIVAHVHTFIMVSEHIKSIV